MLRSLPFYTLYNLKYGARTNSVQWHAAYRYELLVHEHSLQIHFFFKVVEPAKAIEQPVLTHAALKTKRQL